MNAAFCARQLGHSVEMFHRTYAKWLDGEQNDREMERLEAAIALSDDPLQRLRHVLHARQSLRCVQPYQPAVPHSSHQDLLPDSARAQGFE